MSSLDQIKAMLGTTETQAKTAQKVDFEPITAQPFYAPDPFDDADEYIAACRAHGMAVHRTVLECARGESKVFVERVLVDGSVRGRESLTELTDWVDAV